MDKNRAVERCGIRRALPIVGVVLSLVASGLVLSAAPANAAVKPPPSVVDAEVLTPYQLANQVKAAEALRADLMKSGAQVAVANTRIERLSAQATRLLTNLSAARAAEVAAETKAAAQEAHLIELGLFNIDEPTGQHRKH